MGFSPQGRKESDMAERLSLYVHMTQFFFLLVGG